MARIESIGDRRWRVRWREAQGDKWKAMERMVTGDREEAEAVRTQVEMASESRIPRVR